MHERKKLMADLADAFIALPGGYGTFDELCEMLTWNQLGIHVKPVVLVNLDGLLRRLPRAARPRASPIGCSRRRIARCSTWSRDVDDALDAARALAGAAAAPKWCRDPVPEP